MVKKVRDLSEEEKNRICHKYAKIGTCSDKCPLYRVKPNRPRLCSELPLKNSELDKEIELDDR